MLSNSHHNHQYCIIDYYCHHCNSYHDHYCHHCYGYHDGHLLVEGGLLHLKQPHVSSNARFCAEFHLEANIKKSTKKIENKIQL